MKALKNKTVKMIKSIIPTSETFIKLMGVTALCLSSFAVNANNGDENSLSPEKVISEKIHSPKLNGTPLNEKVKVVFTTDASGKVNYCLAKTQSIELKTAVENQFAGLKFTGTQTNIVYTVVLNFKTL